MRLGFIEKFVLWRTYTHHDGELGSRSGPEPHHRSELIIALFREIYLPTVPRRSPVNQCVPSPFYERLQVSVSRAMRNLTWKGLIQKGDLGTRSRFFPLRRVSYLLTSEGRRVGRSLDLDQRWRFRKRRSASNPYRSLGPKINLRRGIEGSG